ENKRVVIMGAGPAGLTAAYQLIKAGVFAVVLEKAAVVGGISRTTSYKGFSFDIGGHRFFTKVPAVEQMWHEVLSETDFLRRKRLSRIYYKQKFFYYPLRAGNALLGLGVWNCLAIVASYLKAKLIPIRPETTFEAWVTNRFGARLYRTFFKTYTEKVWGIACSEITADWAAQRIKDLSLWSAAKNALIGQSGSNSKVIRTLIDSFQYPRKGPGMMWEAVRTLVRDRGADVVTESPVEKVRWAPARVVSVTTKSDGNAREITGTHFLSTLPIRELIHKLDPPAPASIQAAADRLKYRDFITVALILDRKSLFPDNWIYIHDPRVKVGRIQNFKNWSADMVPDQNKTCLGLEYFCFEGDGLWQLHDDELVQLAGRELVILGLVAPEEIEDGTVARMPKAYPVYDFAYKEALREVREFLGSLGNLQLMGRNGMHRYNNQDHSMLTAMLAVKNILGENHDLWDVNVAQQYEEEVTTGDEGIGTSTQPIVPERVKELASL
ncbi:MAG: amine oxidase, partial [Spartobacteria bacterium]|nr:amine oxidase [Spartobacteria bacterium]